MKFAPNLHILLWRCKLFLWPTFIGRRWLIVLNFTKIFLNLTQIILFQKFCKSFLNGVVNITVPFLYNTDLKAKLKHCKHFDYTNITHSRSVKIWCIRDVPGLVDWILVQINTLFYNEECSLNGHLWWIYIFKGNK